MKRKPATAGQVLSRLESDPAFLARRDERERKRKEFGRQYRAAAKPIEDDLAAIGYDDKYLANQAKENLVMATIAKDTPWSALSWMANTDEAYPTAIPILVKHLLLEYPTAIKQTMARALTVKEARGLANQVVLDEYARTPFMERKNHKWELASCLNAIARFEDVPRLCEFVRDKSNGWTRDMLVRALGRFAGRNSEAKQTLESVMNDNEIGELAKKELVKNARKESRKTKPS